MAKKILIVGFNLASDKVHDSQFSDKTSLLDWDIVLFRPNISEFMTYDHGFGDHAGKTSLNDRQSFRLSASTRTRWR